MTGRRILLDVAPDGAEAAALIDAKGRLEDLLLSEAEPGPRPEAVLSGRIARRMPAIGGAFLDLGRAESGFLNIDGAAPAKGGLSEGARVWAEIRAWPEAGKAWPLSQRPALRSRRLSLTPGAPGLNLSRAIEGAEAREEIRARVLEGLGGDAAALTEEGLGCVIRTAAGGEPAGLVEEAAWLLSRWRALAAGAEGWPGPGAVALALRDWGAAPALATPRSLGAPMAAALASGIAPSDPRRAAIAEGEADLFERADVWAQAEAAIAPRAALARGAWMAVEPTAALVAVDVNSGAESGPLDADLAAAAALPRRLRISGLAGLIIVDFLSQKAKDRERIAAALSKGLRGDPAQTDILGFTAGGLLEMRRKRTRRRLTQERLRRFAGGASARPTAERGEP